MDTDAIDRLFEACDLDGSGFIDEDELANICSDLSREEVGVVFSELDRDGDGKISVSEFAAGFKEIRDSLLKPAKDSNSPIEKDAKVPRRSRDRRSNWNHEETKQRSTFEAKVKEVVGGLDESFGALSCQEQVCELYQTLHSLGMSEVLTQFEDIVLGVIKDIRHQQAENETLEKQFIREKEEHMRHLRQLEEETENQVLKVEAKIRKQEAMKSDAEKAEIKSQLEAEMAELKANLVKLQTLEQEVRAQEKPNDELKERLNEVYFENRALKSNLTEAQTNLSLLRSEMVSMKQNLEEKCYELEMEKHSVLDYAKEQENLARQIQMLQSANQRLHDTNDDLRSALDTTRSPFKRSYSQTVPMPPPMRQHSHVKRRVCPQLGSTGYQELNTNRRMLEPAPVKPKSILPLIECDEEEEREETAAQREEAEGSGRSSRSSQHSMRGDIINQYLNSSQALHHMDHGNLAAELKMVDHPSLPAQDSCEWDSLPDDIDSGHSTLRDAHDPDGDSESEQPDESPLMFAPRIQRHSRMMRGEFNDHEIPESELDSVDYVDDDDVDLPDVDMHECMHDHHLERPPSRTCSNCSRASSHSSRRSMPRRKILSPQPIITKEPERMYKIVLAGDAAVGKSSFIMRLCKNKFVNNLNSTLGVDFQTKVIEVDGRVIALQLWDTAGQERFRSIAKSYFRRADGVLLLYDCSYERSFINLRDWVEAVEEGTASKIPLMIAGNKTDLRREFEAEGRRCVRTDEGHRLAREYDALFIETSAKEGDYILEAVTELARLLRTTEDLEVRNVGMQLQDYGKESRKSVSCCS